MNTKTIEQNTRSVIANAADGKKYVDKLSGDIKQFCIRSKDHGAELLKLASAAFYVAAHTEIANYDPLNELFSGTSESDKQGIRLFARRIMNDTNLSFEVTAEDGSVRRKTFFTFTAQSGFSAYKAKDEGQQKIVLDLRKRITSEIAPEGLALIGMGSGDAAERLEREFNPARMAENFLKALVRNGMKADALEINRVLPKDFKVEKSVIEAEANKADPAKRWAKAQASYEKAKAAHERMAKANKGGETTVETTSEKKAA